MIDKNIIKLYLNDNKHLTILEGKKPVITRWTTNFPDEKEIFSHLGNLGWVIGEDDLVIDVDPKNGGEASFEDLKNYIQTFDITQTLEPSVLTPSGGFHIYMKIPKQFKGFKLKKTLKEYPGIDFLTQGSQCVIPGSKTEKGKYVFYDDLLEEYYQIEAHEELIKMISSDAQMKAVYSPDIDQLDDVDTALLQASQGNTSDNTPISKVRDLLDYLNPSMGHDEWFKVGMALHNWDSSQRGLDLWEEWSREGENYQEGVTATKWRSFTSGGGITLGTISHMASEAVFDEERTRVRKYIDLINGASDDKEIEFDIAPKIRREQFKQLNLEKIAKSIQEKLKHFEGVNLSIRLIREMVKSTNIEEMKDKFDDKTKKIPDWCKKWVFVNTHDGFFDIETLKLHKLNSFNFENGIHVPVNETGTKPNAFKYVSDRGLIQKVHSTVYMPSNTQQVITIEGSKALNTFNPRTIPIESQKYTKSGTDAIKRVKKHIAFICSNDKENIKVLTQWFAHQVQYPGRKILWAPIIQSIQGVGKSFFGELLRMVLGDTNIGTVSPTQVVSDFNGWATNRCVNVLEELRVKGKNRHDCVNALKYLITDRIIQINDKNVSQFNTYNTANYICFTNFKDAIPIDENDRRWWVLFVEVSSLAQMSKIVGEDIVSYFPNLFDSIRKHASEIRKWLLEYPISPEFMNTKQAPMTKYKQAMINTESEKYEGLNELKELLDKGGPYFNHDIVCPTELFNALHLEYPTLEVFKTKQKHFLLGTLGFQSMGAMFVGDKTRRVWSKRPVGAAEARKLLEDRSFYLNEDGSDLFDDFEPEQEKKDCYLDDEISYDDLDLDD